MGSRVRVLNVTHVRPTETSNPLPDTDDDDHAAIKLSLFDTMFLAYQPMQRLFFYDGDDLPPFPALLATLQSSLAATLAVFTPLAGNLAVTKSGDDEDVVVIDCSRGAVAQGVRFVEAEYAGGGSATDEMRRLASAAEHDADAYAQLAPALEIGALPVPALAVQVTRPAADTGDGDDGDRIGAVVVGVSMCHVVADGHALWEFIRAWAATARGGSPDLPGFLLPVFDRAVINRHPKAEAVSRTFQRIFAPALPMVNAFPKPDPTLQGRRTYMVSASQIRWLKQRISQQSNCSLAVADGNGNGNGAPPPATKPPPTTTFAAVVSLVWTSGMRAKNLQSGAAAATDDAYLLFAADCRARLRPPTPAAFFGNCVKLCYARATVGELIRDDGGGAGGGALARAAAAVREAVREQLEEADPLGDADRWLERYQAVPPERFVQIGSSHRFAAYETDFGWGGPRRVELAAVFVREFVAVVGAPDGAVQVSVVLDRERMDGFEASFLSQLHGSV